MEVRRGISLLSDLLRGGGLGSREEEERGDERGGAERVSVSVRASPRRRARPGRARRGCVLVLLELFHESARAAGRTRASAGPRRAGGGRPPHTPKRPAGWPSPSRHRERPRSRLSRGTRARRICPARAARSKDGPLALGMARVSAAKGGPSRGGRRARERERGQGGGGGGGLLSLVTGALGEKKLTRVKKRCCDARGARSLRR